MTEDHTDYSLSARLIDPLVTPPIFKSAAGWIAETEHLPEAFRPAEPFLLAAVSSLLLQPASFSCNRARARFSVNFQTLMMSWQKKNTNSDLMSSKIFVQNYCPVWTPPLIIWLKFVARVPRERSRPSCFLNRPFSLPNLPVCKHLTCDSSFGCPSSEGGNVSELQPLPSHQVSKRHL